MNIQERIDKLNNSVDLTAMELIKTNPQRVMDVLTTSYGPPSIFLENKAHLFTLTLTWDTLAELKELKGQSMKFKP